MSKKSKIFIQITLYNEILFLEKSPIFQYTYLKNLIQFIIEEMVQVNLISKTENRELSFYFTINKEIQELNKNYLKEDFATDVLAFPFLSSEILGDIVLSIEKIMEQAVQANISYLKELTKLIIHGILHILGYDHETCEEKKIMFSLQEKILLEVLKNF